MEKTILSFCALTSLAVVGVEIEGYYRRLYVFLKTFPLQEKKCYLLLIINIIYN